MFYKSCQFLDSIKRVLRMNPFILITIYCLNWLGLMRKSHIPTMLVAQASHNQFLQSKVKDYSLRTDCIHGITRGNILNLCYFSIVSYFSVIGIKNKYVINVKCKCWKRHTQLKYWLSSIQEANIDRDWYLSCMNLFHNQCLMNNLNYNK